MADRQSPAHQVIANPVAFADRPWLYAVAWDILLTSRGRTFHVDTAGPARHHIEPERPGDLMDRIRARAAEIGWPARRTLICPGART
ncbi:hypothetical protein [Seohaeicola zhoushanensis]|uniref:Uncharacterized protein n=1 Tax=Seohaeicola zhoushanensis TaxID=1569283 RepID=A0A8J3H325_9RHOB|nr:hypothetical protein [Seohaeicola zhoushanensis]GHF70997.1 hypothetical protein GCM10017056_47390 [Seohaeicola zhoushanensis]